MVTTPTIRDQRTMTGDRYRATIADVEAAWHIRAARRPVAWEGRTKPEAAGATLTAYVSANRWVADCPNCGAGLACWTENPHGCCMGCGLIYDINFPAGWKDAEKVLLQRPARNRHWLPGETIVQLKAENIAQSNLPGQILAVLDNPDLKAH